MKALFTFHESNRDCFDREKTAQVSEPGAVYSREIREGRSARKSFNLEFGDFRFGMWSRRLVFGHPQTVRSHVLWGARWHVKVLLNIANYNLLSTIP